MRAAAEINSRNREFWEAEKSPFSKGAWPIRIFAKPRFKCSIRRRKEGSPFTAKYRITRPYRRPRQERGLAAVRVHDRDDQGALLVAREFAGRRSPHLEHDIGAVRRVGANCGAGRDI